MKKLLSVLLIAMLALSLAVAAFAEAVSVPEAGLVLVFPEDGSADNVYAYEVDESGLLGVGFYYMNDRALAPYREAYEKAKGDEEALALALQEYSEALPKHYRELCLLIGVRTELVGMYAELFNGAAEVGSSSTHTYFILPRGDSASLADEEKAPAEAALAAAEKVATNAVITEAEGYAATGGALSGLSTVDTEGNAVDGSLFSGAELTVLHVWATDCGPCIREMPALSAWAEELPDNVQVVGLITDAYSTSDRTCENARRILSASGCGFVNLLNDGSLAPITDTLIGTPTTFFLDSNGNSVASPVLGASLEQYKQRVAILAK